ncbi:hypothetical protein FRC11_010342 [Ceratobasidium sp. 423]|nr:hypothetical protein FRC11_010342 [Ceratobasidium sp. 423]
MFFSVTTTTAQLPVSIEPQSDVEAQVRFNPQGRRGRFEDRLEFVFRDQVGTFVITRPVKATAGNEDVATLAPTAPYQRPHRAREHDQANQKIIDVDGEDAMFPGPQVNYLPGRTLKVDAIPDSMRRLLQVGRGPAQPSLEDQTDSFRAQFLPETFDIDTFQRHWSNLVHAEHIQAEIDLKEFDMNDALGMNTKRSEVLFPELGNITASALTAQHTEEPEIELYNHTIGTNEEQRNAIAKVMQLPPGSPPFIIFGPPGTGKTVTVVECISQLLNDKKSRILACAPSNSASDLIAQRLIDHQGLQTSEIFRLNALQRQRVTLPDDLVQYSLMSTNGHSFRVPGLEQLKSYRVLVATCSTAALLYGVGVDPGTFTHIFIDEAGQGSEPEVMIPILMMAGPKTNIVLSGDPKQLGPVIRSPVARPLGLNVSYLDRLMASPAYDEVAMRGISVVKLRQNFRSHERIIAFPNDEFYLNDLVACAPENIANSLLNWNGLASANFPVVFDALMGKDEQEEKSPSYFNPHEASLVKEYVQQLIPFIASPRDIGIVTPYKAQVRKIRKLLVDIDITEIDIGSVEQFQGQERRVIIVSTVRSNKDLLSFDLRHTLGFVSNAKRLNVAITRAQSLLVVIGDPLVLGLDALWRRFLYFVNHSGGWKGAPFPWNPDADPDEDPATVDMAEQDLRELLRRAAEPGSPGELDPDNTGGE